MRLFVLCLLALTLLGGPVAFAQGKPPKPSKPADRKATRRTKRLYRNMQRLAQTKLMFGHQDDLAYGLENGKRWVGDANRSDVKSVTGAYPAVFGWELGHIELDSARSLDAVPFAKIREYVQQVYAMGGINTISWHLNSPHSGGMAWDTARTVSYILPGGADHAKYITYLDRLATFLESLKGPKGEAIPILFRPFHEHTGPWFWWGETHCTAAEYKQLWQFSIDYLRNTKKLHNLIVIYSSADVRDKAHYLERYPGDAYVDIVGFDTYYFGDGSGFFRLMKLQLPIVAEVAREHHKMATLAESGYERLPLTDWWTKTLLPTLAGYPLSYVMVWRNGRPDHYYTPYPGHPNAPDFKLFYADPRVLFLDKLAPMHMYK